MLGGQLRVLSRAGDLVWLVGASPASAASHGDSQDPGEDMNVWIDGGGSVGRKSVIGNVSVPHRRSKMVFPT